MTLADVARHAIPNRPFHRHGWAVGYYWFFNRHFILYEVLDGVERAYDHISGHDIVAVDYEWCL